MEFLRRILGAQREGALARPSQLLFESTAAMDARRGDSVIATLDIDAAINAHERWKDRLMDYLEGRSTVGLDPALVRRTDHSVVGRWLHGEGGEVLGDQPVFPVLMARYQYFHEQAAVLVELAQQGEWDRAVQVLNGRYRHGSSQVVWLLKELQRGLVRSLAKKGR